MYHKIHQILVQLLRLEASSALSAQSPGWLWLAFTSRLGRDSTDSQTLSDSALGEAFTTCAIVILLQYSVILHTAHITPNSSSCLKVLHSLLAIQTKENVPVVIRL